MAGIFLNGKLYAGGVNASASGSGIQILPWTPSTEYKYGDLVLRAYNIYQCINTNNDESFVEANWKKVGSCDSEFDIISTISELPPMLDTTEKRLYYCIENTKFYMWDGHNWIIQPDYLTSNQLGFSSIDEESFAVSADGKLSIRNIQDNLINALF